ncbi:MAG: hypothetical protein MUP70_10705 [Candidatus Aminicenantes bacterium]|nr:hypothetical protein [Candidatus Aminicenantes bacterium]
MIQTLSLLWKKKKRSLSKRLQKGIPDLAYVLRPVGEEHSYSQHVINNEIHWCNKDGRVEIVFFYIAAPCDLDVVYRVFQRTKDTRCEFSCLFVHQWTAGEGNWDVFGLHPQRGLVHWNRFWGNRFVIDDKGVVLRDDIYRLFECGQDFPALSRKRWAVMLGESREKTVTQLSIVAGEHNCIQTQRDDVVQWYNENGRMEAMFFVFQNFPNLDDYIAIYNQIKINRCPVTFLFQKVQPGMFDIFRLSARSYIEHHNQAK